jgi:hypothetical protein
MVEKNRKQHIKKYKQKPSRDMLRERGLRIEDLVEAYEKEKTIKGASALLKVNAGTFHRIMQKNGYVFTRGRQGFKKKHTSIVANWLRKYSDKKLPRNYKEISTIMDIPVSTVRAYFKRRQERLQAILREDYDIIGLDLFGLRDVAGHMYTNKGLSATKIYVDDFALCFIVKASTLSGNRLTFVVQQDEYLKMFNKEQKEK